MDLEISNMEKNLQKNTDFSEVLNNHLELEGTTFSIDRFEEDFAVCENRKTGEITNIKKILLPENVKEGSIIKYENGKFILDAVQTLEKQAQIKSMVNNLFKKK